MPNRNFAALLVLLLCCLIVCASVVSAKTTTFTYQGKLTDGGAPAKGVFDLEFKLFDNGVGGAQQGATLTREDVSVTSGVFTVQLDFGAMAFPGAVRFLEIGVRPGAQTGALTLLSPRQPVQSTPYAIRSLNAGNLNLFAGVGAGALNTSGSDNAFIGAFAGEKNMTGSFNAFVGRDAGVNNSSGGDNAFFGALAGQINTTGSGNAFFGMEAGGGLSDGDNNTFIGQNAGALNSTGDNNTLIGQGANLGGAGFSFATAIGSQAAASASNRIQLGRNGTDTVSIGLLTAATATHVCINGTVLSHCSSSQRYKQNVQPLRAGLNLIGRLRPVTFDGVIEGVKYDQLAVVLINAVKEQQTLLEEQRQEYQLRAQKLETENHALKERLSALERLVQGWQAQLEKTTPTKPQ